MVAKQKIWIIESDAEALERYKRELEQHFDTTSLYSLLEFNEFSQRSKKQAQLILSAFQIKDGCILSNLKNYQNKHRDIPWIIVGGAKKKEDIYSCFEAGAFDYLSKPVDAQELSVKIERALSKGLQSSKFQLSEQASDQLTLKELKIYSVLQKAEDNLASRETIIAAVWGTQQLSAKSFDVHLFHLRKKIWKMGLQIKFISPNNYQLIRAID